MEKTLVQVVLINPLYFSPLAPNLQNPIQTTRVHLFAARLGFKETLAFGNVAHATPLHLKTALKMNMTIYCTPNTGSHAIPLNATPINFARHASTRESIHNLVLCVPNANAKPLKSSLKNIINNVSF